jgi:hypothetical protein
MSRHDEDVPLAERIAVAKRKKIHKPPAPRCAHACFTSDRPSDIAAATLTDSVVCLWESIRRNGLALVTNNQQMIGREA